MKTKLIALVVLGFVLVIVVTVEIASTSKQEQIAELQNAPDRGTIRWHAKMARVKGERQVVLPGPIAEYATAVKVLDEVLPHFAVVVAQPSSKKSFISSTNEIYKDNEIRTWYKFKILENLSQKQIPRCSNCGAVSERIPQEMLPLNRDEILIEVSGGTVTIEGIKITVVDRQIPPFSISEKYLLFLSADPSGMVGLLRMGPIGIYTLSPNGVVEPVSQQPNPFILDVATHYNNIEELRRYIQSRASVQ